MMIPALLMASAVLAQDKKPFADAVGSWEIRTEANGRSIPAMLVLRVDKDGKLRGTWSSMGRESELTGLAFKDGTLSFDRPMRGGSLRFTAKIADGKLVGKHSAEGMGELPAKGRRLSAAELKDPVREFERNSRRAAPRDAFEVLDDPKMTAAADAKLADREYVIGLVVNGEAKAYPVRVMGRHELVNDTCGRDPVAVSW
jgi:hypothetical protein